MKLYTVNIGNSREETLSSHFSPLSVFMLLFLSFAENVTGAREKISDLPSRLAIWTKMESWDAFSTAALGDD